MAISRIALGLSSRFGEGSVCRDSDSEATFDLEEYNSALVKVLPRYPTPLCFAGAL